MSRVRHQNTGENERNKERAPPIVVNLPGGATRQLALRTTIDIPAIWLRRADLANRKPNPCIEGVHRPLKCNHSCDPEKGVHIGRCTHELSRIGFPVGPIPCSARCLKPSGEVSPTAKVLSCEECEEEYLGYGYYPLSLQLSDGVTFVAEAMEELSAAKDDVQEEVRELLINRLHRQVRNLPEHLSELGRALPRDRDQLLHECPGFMASLKAAIITEMHEYHNRARHGLRQRMDALLEQDRLNSFQYQLEQPASNVDTEPTQADLDVLVSLLEIIEFENFEETDEQDAKECISAVLGNSWADHRLIAVLGPDVDACELISHSIKPYKIANTIMSYIEESATSIERSITNTPGWLVTEPARSRHLLYEAVTRGTRDAAAHFQRLLEVLRANKQNRGIVEEKALRHKHLDDINALIAMSAGYWTLETVAKYTRALLKFCLQHSLMDADRANKMIVRTPKGKGMSGIPAFCLAELAAQIGASEEIRNRCRPLFELIKVSERLQITYHHPHGPSEPYLTALDLVKYYEQAHGVQLMDMSADSIEILGRLIGAARLGTTNGGNHFRLILRDPRQEMAEIERDFIAALRDDRVEGHLPT